MINICIKWGNPYKFWISDIEPWIHIGIILGALKNTDTWILSEILI